MSPEGQEDRTWASGIHEIGGLVAVALGIVAVTAIALAALFLVVIVGTGKPAVVTGMATGAFGVISAIVGAFFGIKVGTDQTKNALQQNQRLAKQAQSAEVRADVYALHVPENRAGEAVAEAKSMVAQIMEAPSAEAE